MRLSDKGILEAAFRKHYNLLCNYVKPIVGEDSLAEDVVQDVFVHLWRKRAEVDVEENWTPYLLQACKNKALELLRKQKRRNETSLNQEVLNTAEPDAEKLWLKEQINYSIRQLPPKCQEVFTLCKIKGLSYAEIAGQLNISVKTVENHMGKAFKLLRKSLRQTVEV